MNKLMYLAMNFLAETDVDTGDEDLNKILNNIFNLINNVLMPIIWISLAAFLTIKGAMLGTQIVKAADEPQVRQEKISSLKYLVIGILVAVGVSVAATFLIDYFKKQLLLDGTAFLPY